MQGRLTLEAGKPESTTNLAGKNSIFYSQHTGNKARIWNGSDLVERKITTSVNDRSGLQFDLVKTAGFEGRHAPGNIHDLFTYWNGSATKVGSGPAWSSICNWPSTDADRGYSLDMEDGVETNAAAIVLRIGPASGDLITVDPHKASLIGAFFVRGDTGDLSMEYRPEPAIGGTGNVMCLSNAYGQLPQEVLCRDSEEWTYTATEDTNSPGTFLPRMAHNSDKNRIWFLNCRSGNQIFSEAQRSVEPAGQPDSAYTNGVALNDWTNLSGCTVGQTAFIGTEHLSGIARGFLIKNAPMGLNLVQEMEQGTLKPMLVRARDCGALRLSYRS